MTKTKDCINCGASFTALRMSKRFCSQRCQEAASRKRRKAGPLPLRQCPTCLQDFKPTRVDKRFCSNVCCVKFNQQKRTRPATHLPAVDSAVTARLFADGLYLGGGLREEIERVRKAPGIVASLEAQLREAMIADAIWPIGRVGRIAVTLALLKDHSLLGMPVKWRHPHEHRRRPGEPRKPTGVGFRAYGRPGSRA